MVRYVVEILLDTDEGRVSHTEVFAYESQLFVWLERYGEEVNFSFYRKKGNKRTYGRWIPPSNGEIKWMEKKKK